MIIDRKILLVTNIDVGTKYSMKPLYYNKQSRDHQECPL